ncbi:MAG: hypothetical protein SOV58_04175 [Candidatus Enteromonas sp.]|nr:hypothetical protein [Candidatus Enteromonas sp.]
MKKKTFAICSISFLLPLASCGPAASEISSSSKSEIPFVMPQGLFLRLEIGEAKAVDLAETIQGDFTLASESPNILLSGTKVIGMDYGPFEVKVLHNDEQHRISGEVITKQSKEMEIYLSDLQSTYVAFDSFSGVTLSGDDYYAFMIGQDENSGAYLYSGGIQDPSSSLYIPFYLGSTPLQELGEEMVFSKASYYAGYERSKESLSMEGWTLSFYELEEQHDGSGDSTGEFVYLPEDPSLVYSLYRSLLGSENPLPNLIFSYGGAAGLSLKLTPSSLRILPIDQKKNPISSVSVSGYSIPTEIHLWGSDLMIPAFEEWRNKPTIPPQFPRNELPEYFQSLQKADSFTYTIDASWQNPETGAKTASPSTFVFSDTGTTMFSSFALKGVYQGSALEKTVVEIEEKATSLSGHLPKKRDRTLERISSSAVGKSFQTWKGEETEEGFLYGNRSSVPSRYSDFFSANILPGALAASSLWDQASIVAKTSEEDGTIRFVYTPNGSDFSSYSYNSFLGGIPYAFHGMDYGDLSLCGLLYLYYLEFAWTSCAFELAVNPLSQEFSFLVEFQYSSELVYRYSLSIFGINSSSLSPEALQAIEG